MTESSPVVISKRLVLINSISGIVTRVLTVGVFAWAIQYLINRIPEEELALLPIVGSITMILPLLQTALAGGLARHVTEAYARNDLDKVTRIVSSQFPLLLAGAVLTIVLGVLMTWNVHYVLNVPPSLLDKLRFMLLLVIGRLALGMVVVPFTTGLFARQRFVLQNVIDIAGSVLRIALMLGLILGIGPGVEWVIVAQVASQVFMLLTETAVSMRGLPALRFRPSSFDWNTCKEVLSFSGWNFVTESANLIRRAADAPILNVFATPVAVNSFFLGSLIETQLRQMAITASQPLMPALTAMYANQQNARLAGAFLRGGRIALWASMFLAIPLILFSNDLFALYLGSEYVEHVEAGTVMIILLLTFPLGYPTTMFSRICFARGDIRPIAVRTIVAQLGNLALTLVLVGKFHMGAIGSATATLTSLVIVHPFFFWPLALRTLEMPWRRFVWESLVPGMLPAVVAACAALLSTQFVGDSAPVRVVAGISVCLSVYTICLAFALRAADRRDLGRIRQFVRGRFS